MVSHIIDEALRVIHASTPYTTPGSELDPPSVLQSEAKPPVAWNAANIETPLKVNLPQEIKLLWSKASELRLNDDVNYGQWGCILWSPAKIVANHKKRLRWRGSENFRKGDLLIGEFLGDVELVVLRCNPEEPDYGKILIAIELEKREEWPCVASSISEFVLKYLENRNQKYWYPSE